MAHAMKENYYNVLKNITVNSKYGNSKFTFQIK